MAQIISDWKDKRLRVGWTIRLNNGKLAVITWINPNGGYTCKVIQTLLDARPLEEGNTVSAQ